MENVNLEAQEEDGMITLRYYFREAGGEDWRWAKWLRFASSGRLWY
jgi:hypothetical protein